MVNHKIINLGDPTNNKDAVNRQYLEQSYINRVTATISLAI